MARTKFKLTDVSRIQKKYPLVRHLPVPRYVADKLVEIETLIIDLNQESEKSATFSEAFTDVPAVAVTLLTNSNPVGSVNVYAYTVSKTGITVRASADITAQVAVQAIYIGA
jgi:hypothetical protein